MGDRLRQLLTIMLLLLGGTGVSGSDDLIWWEGEAPVATNFPRHDWYATGAIKGKQHLLSNRAWLASSVKRGEQPLFARYQVTVPEAGSYDLWTRKFWKHGPFRWRFNDAAWQTCPREVTLADEVILATHLTANWVKLGVIDLPAGEHTFELQLLSKPGEKVAAAFDAFVLSRDPFMPNGALKPGERPGRSGRGWFTVVRPVDAFDVQALLDLRSLNEAEAGQDGFISRDGDRLLLGSGKPVRLWGINVGPERIAIDPAGVEYMARRLAKLGFNAVRIHGALFAADDISRIDPERLEQVHRAVAAFKRNGIYTTLSFYFPSWVKVQPGDGIPGYESQDSKKPVGLIYFNDQLQQLHRCWLRTLLTTPNPHTGRSLAEEPAVAMIELVNEDSLLFWTFAKSRIPAVHWQELERRFGTWLAERYGSSASALEAWQGARQEGDDLGGGRMTLLEAWHMTRDGLKHGGPAKRRRMSDQVRFLTELQHEFYERTTDHVRDDLGYRGLIVASNWQTADPAVLDPAERFSYTAADVIDRHAYFGAPHEGDGSGYSVRTGHAVQDQSLLKHPTKSPVQVTSVGGMPQIISELGWTNPNRYRAEALPFASSYAALQGIDGLFFFAVENSYLRDQSMHKFSMSSPVISGASPAAALMYRRGDVMEGPTVLHEAFDDRRLFSLEPANAAAAALDAMRQADRPSDVRHEETSLTPSGLAYFSGKVTRSYGNQQGPTDQADRDISRLIRPDLSLVVSATQQLLWDYDRGMLTVNTPRAQAVAGFLSAVRVTRLSDVTIESGNSYGSLAVVSLDDKPLGESDRILVQAVTEERPTGYEVRDGKIADLGGPPFQMRQIDATVTLRSGTAQNVRITALNVNGEPMGKVKAVPGNGGEGIRFKLQPDAMYHVIERQ